MLEIWWSSSTWGFDPQVDETNQSNYFFKPSSIKVAFCRWKGYHVHIMKIVLTQRVRGVGDAHDVVNVADGYALNFLIRTKKAISATPAQQRIAQSRKEKFIAEKKVQEKLLEQNIATLSDARISIIVPTNEKGHLYEAVGVSEILSAILEQAKVTLPKDMIKLEHPIKEVGTYDVPVSHGELFGKFSIIVEAQQ